MTTPRILICAPRMPEFDREGGSRRILHVIEFLLDAGWAVSFLAQDATASERYAAALRRLGVATYAGERSYHVDYAVNPTELIALGQFDLALFIFWNVAEDYLPVFRSLSPATRLIVDSIDLHFLRYARSAFHPERSDDGPGVLEPTYAREMARELNAYAAADAVLSVSEKEAGLIGDFLAAPGKVFTVPLMEDLPASPVPFAARRGLLFLANFRHPPNSEAVSYLCDAILPHVPAALLEDHPVLIVGNGLDAEIAHRTAGQPGVRLVGWAPTIVPYVQRVRVSLVPLLHGAGTKTKLIQPLTVGTPSVSTTIGIEGLDLRDGEHVLVADDPPSFAAAITRLVREEELWERLATAGRAHIARRHGREAVRQRLMAALNAQLTR